MSRFHKPAKMEPEDCGEFWVRKKEGQDEIRRNRRPMSPRELESRDFSPRSRRELESQSSHVKPKRESANRKRHVHPPDRTVGRKPHREQTSHRQAEENSETWRGRILTPLTAKVPPTKGAKTNVPNHAITRKTRLRASSEKGIAPSVKIPERAIDFGKTGNLNIAGLVWWGPKGRIER